MTIEPLVFSVCVFLFGTIVGSFLNVCIVRLPLDKSVVFPSSYCPKCETPIAWVDNVPLLSWLLLRGRCRSCKERIPWRYWLVEFLTGVVFMVFYQQFGLNAVLPPYLVMVCCFIVATFVDFEHRIIPDQASVGGMYAGLVLSALVPGLHPFARMDSGLATLLACGIVLLCLVLTWVYPLLCKHLMDQQEPGDDRDVKALVLVSLIFLVLLQVFGAHLPVGIGRHVYSFGAGVAGYLVGGGLIFALGLIGDMIFRKESMGGGDVKLLAMVGAFLGWKLVALSFFIAPFFGAVVGIIEKIRTKDSTIAYGPFLVLGSLVSLFWGEHILRFILSGGFSL